MRTIQIKYLKECHDSTGKVIAENGKGTWIAFNNDLKKIDRTGPVINGRPDGEWQGWAVDGVMQTGIFSNGKLIAGKPYQDEQSDMIFDKVDVNPIFGDKVDSFILKFLVKAVRYPAVDRENNVQGRVIVSFVVERDGSLTDVKALSGPSKTLKDEAVRAVSLSPPWKPALKDGNVVRCQFKVPINFALAGDR